ncbi:hypothetical protein CH282_16145 [Rhodococcus sp. 06-418-1B]|nr:hypothetical protein [Rhodococcus sp. 06-418-1B]OZC83479.1 hypothetical protein CH282_16145 [Rhodococcus sp. 06-418-1B]
MRSDIDSAPCHIASVTQEVDSATIEFDATSKTGKTYRAKGALAAGTYQGSKTFGFKLKFEDPKSTAGTNKRTVRR